MSIKKSYTNNFKCLIAELARKYEKGGKVYAITIGKCLYQEYMNGKNNMIN